MHSGDTSAPMFIPHPLPLLGGNCVDEGNSVDERQLDPFNTIKFILLLYIKLIEDDRAQEQRWGEPRGPTPFE